MVIGRARGPDGTGRRRRSGLDAPRAPSGRENSETSERSQQPRRADAGFPCVAGTPAIVSKFANFPGGGSWQRRYGAATGRTAFGAAGLFIEEVLGGEHVVRTDASEG